MKVLKITHGYVVQTFDTNTGLCIEQSFVGGEDIAYEDENGEPVDWEEEPESSPSYEMVQPKAK